MRKKRTLCNADWNFHVDCKQQDQSLGIPDSFGVRMMHPFTLMPHQVYCAHFINYRELHPHLNIRGGMVCLFCGLGKTLLFLHYAKKLQMMRQSQQHTSTNISSSSSSSSNHRGILIVTDISSAQAWSNDAQKFFGDSLTYTTVTRSHMKSEFDTVSFDQLTVFDVIMTTYDTLKLVHANPTKNHAAYRLLFQHSWQCIVFDESQKLCNEKTQLFASIAELNSWTKWCLTATPIKNSAIDLLNQMRVLGYNGCSDKLQFNLDIFREHKLNEFILTMDYEQARIRLPQLTETYCWIKMTELELRLYRAMFLLTEMAVSDDGCIFADVLSLFTRLRQIVIAPSLIMRNLDKKNRQLVRITDYRFESPSHMEMTRHTFTTGTLSQMLADRFTLLRARHIDKFDAMLREMSSIDDFLQTPFASTSSSKMNAIREVLGRIESTAKVVIFSDFANALSIVNDALLDRQCLSLTGKTNREERVEILKEFASSHVSNTLLMSTGVGSTSLNIQCAQHVIFIDVNWTRSTYQQAVARVHRIGQTKPVTVWNILTKGSLDVAIHQLASAKRQISDIYLNKQTNEDRGEHDIIVPKLSVATMKLILEMTE